ncbi:hypothetical protein L6452_38776 [Arctium lappa]|uniref:Uncharacterized protein n=1 Tax=Arctium lappa TaxID=4217 RepID=A0ACB8XRM3_ARCLA|nr:hypothetical protein L6452_38776 [Arctium lappa]
MEDQEVVYDIGYGYGNPCRYLQHVLTSLLRCFGLENQEEGKERSGGGGGGGGGGGEVEDPPLPSSTSPSSDPPVIDPTDEPVSIAAPLNQSPKHQGNEGDEDNDSNFNINSSEEGDIGIAVVCGASDISFSSMEVSGNYDDVRVKPSFEDDGGFVLVDDLAELL